jgi:phosphatidylserine/phosphatidylglycerophosphate/cardiolipin synthase-like enzyme
MKLKKDLLKYELFYNIVIMVICLSCAFYMCIDKPEIKTCFTPNGSCTEQVVDAINDAKKSIFLQAYYLTSEPIITALLRAKDNGVDVHFILDKTQRKSKYLAEFKKHHIPVFIDDKVRIAHNKVMIIDGKEVITGSFNFTNAAQYYNAENVVFIKDKKTAKEYFNNWNNEILLINERG